MGEEFLVRGPCHHADRRDEDGVPRHRAALAGLVDEGLGAVLEVKDFPGQRERRELVARDHPGADGVLRKFGGETEGVPLIEVLEEDAASLADGHAALDRGHPERGRHERAVLPRVDGDVFLEQDEVIRGQGPSTFDRRSP